MSSMFNQDARTGARPPAAVELTPEGVLAAALPPGKGAQAPVYAYEALPEWALVPSINEVNLKAPDVVAQAIKSALGQLSTRSRAVTVVVPDSVVRVFVLDFDSLPSKAADVYPVLRFRLRKMVPFDVEHAGVSYQVLRNEKNDVKVLAAVMPGPVLAEYENAVRSAGYEPGAVLPSSLAAQEAIEATGLLEAVLIANLSTQSLTTSITNGQDLLLYRTLDLPADTQLRLGEVQRGIAVAAAYFEDKLGFVPRRLLYAGTLGGGRGGAEAFAEWIGAEEISVTDLTPKPSTGAANSLRDASIAGVTGALAGAR
jgi:type IV pilus assembly protein PilM